MVNATYLQYVEADALNDNPRNRRIIEAAFSRERGAILVAGDPVAESIPSDDRYDFQRVYGQPFKYAPLTGAFSYFSQTGIERSQNEVLSGDDERLFVTRLVDLIGNSSPKGGSVQLTIDPAAQTAAWDGIEALGPGTEGAVVALEPATGKVLAMVSSPSYDPNLLASHDFDSVLDESARLEADESEPLINRSIQTTLPPGSTFKLVTAAATIEDGNYTTGDDLVPGGPTYQLPLTEGPTGLIDNGGRDCGGKKITFTQALANSCNTTFLALADELGVEKMQAQAEAFGFNSEYLDDPPLQAESRYPGDLDRAADGDVGHRPVRGRRHPAADGDGGGRHRQRRDRDEALHRRRGHLPRARRARQDRAFRAVEGGRAVHRGRADPDDGRDRQRRYGDQCTDPRHRGGRQDRDRAEHPGPAAVRLVRLVRPGHRPAGGGGGAGRGELDPP